jgi:carboxylesterase
VTWHGQINRTIWEIEHLLKKKPNDLRLRRELLRTHFLQRYEFDRSLHVPRDDRSFLFLQDGKAPACLLLHGANGTPAEMRDLGNYLYSRGITIYCPRMSRYDVKNRLVSWESWVTMAEGALRTALDYSQQTMVLGLGIGATITLVLNRLHTFKGMVLLAPALYPRLGFKGRMLDIVRIVTPTLFYRFSGWNGELNRAMENVRKTPGEIKAPALVLQAQDDQVISTKGLRVLRRRLANEKSEVVLLPSGSHTITRSEARQDVFKRVYEFARDIRLVGRGTRRGGGLGGRSGRQPSM